MKFPLVESFLLMPDEGKNGNLAICTNTLAPGMVINEVPLDKRSNLSVLGSLVVSRDGAERMIVNSLVHPHLQYIILFGEETLSFKPSTNLLLALMNGYNLEQKGNQIINGKGVAHHYPSISKELLNKFRETITVIPFYTSHGDQEVISNYMAWLKPQIPEDVFNFVIGVHAKGKIYYDSLVKLIDLISKLPVKQSETIVLDAKEFQHLQPPVIVLEDFEKKNVVPFLVSKSGSNIKIDLDIGDDSFTISGNDGFLIAYSIMDFMNKNNLILSNENQLLLGAEISRIEVEIKNDVPSESFIISQIRNSSRKEIPLASRTLLKPDSLFYYKVTLKDGFVSVQSLAHDTCTSVFDLRAKSLMPIINKLVEEDRFEDYEQRILHRLDTGIEVGRAMVALKTGNSYFQDFRNLFSINTDKYNLFILEADSFLGNHQKIITKLYTNGLTMQHPDTHKGTMRCGGVLAIYRNSGESLKTLPALYSSGSQGVEAMREEYKKNLLDFDNSGTYTYGSRTRAHFGRDQLLDAVTYLKKNPNKPYVIQRFDYVEDMGVFETPIKDDKGNVIRTRIEATHDPCLSHDIYFISNNKLYCFHIARAHNIVNAYPENIFGLHDAYDSFISKELGIPLGDMFMLSSRANILLLTEEQKAKRLIAEPAKPVGLLDNSIGPYNLLNNSNAKGVGYAELKLIKNEIRPDHPCLDVLENYSGVNLISKAANYLKTRGMDHNNPVIGSYNPKTGELNESNRLISLQCNERAKKLQVTAVFLNGSKETLQNDIELCNYIATQFGIITNRELDNLFLFYVPMV